MGAEEGVRVGEKKAPKRKRAAAKATPLGLWTWWSTVA